jgi:hypothetical protein
MFSRADSSAPQVKALLKRKREYLSQLQISIKEVSKKEELARKRAREELPSDAEDEKLPSQTGGQGGKRSRENSGKRRRSGGGKRKEGIEEEIVVPRITPHCMTPPIQSSSFVFVQAACLWTDVDGSVVPVSFDSAGEY